MKCKECRFAADYGGLYLRCENDDAPFLLVTNEAGCDMGEATEPRE